MNAISKQTPGHRKPYVQSQLMLPLLVALQDAGGQLSSQDACYAVAKAIDLPETDRTAVVQGGHYRAFDRDVRWAQQKAKFSELISVPRFGQWEITRAGRKALRNALPGIVITIYESDDGVALWADCRDAFSHVEPGSISAIISSPPYPLLRQKDYGNKSGQDYIDWMSDLAASWKPLIKDTGSLVLNLGDCWNPGHPSLNLYAERLLLRLVDDVGFRLAQRFEWHSPSRLPAPAQWVCVTRQRVKPSLERIYWLTKGDHLADADNRRVLVPYSDSMKARIAGGGETGGRRPSGHQFKPGAFSSGASGGAIPSNLLVASNTESSGHYQSACRNLGLPIHPARFPAAIPEFFIKLCTQPGDVVADPFGGSFVTAAAARGLGRRFITSEMSLDYALGGVARLGGAVPRELFHHNSP